MGIRGGGGQEGVGVRGDCGGQGEWWPKLWLLHIVISHIAICSIISSQCLSYDLDATTLPKP